MVLLGSIKYGDASQGLLELPRSRCQRGDCLFGTLPSQHTCGHHRKKGCLGATGPCTRWMEGVRAEECRQFLGLRLLFCTSPDRHPRRTRGHHQLLVGRQLRRRLVAQGDPPHLSRRFDTREQCRLYAQNGDVQRHAPSFGRLHNQGVPLEPGRIEHRSRKAVC